MAALSSRCPLRITTAAVVASVVLYIVGIVWYAVLFAEPWAKASGVKSDDASSSWMAAGILLELIKATGVSWLLEGRGLEGNVVKSIEFGASVGLLFGVSGVAYELVYSAKHNLVLFFIDAGYSLTTFVVAAIVISTLNGKKTAAAATNTTTTNTTVTRGRGRSRSPARNKK
jgi:predicted membrane channel-forming protein YqfA (hemolysin III family)